MNVQSTMRVTPRPKTRRRPLRDLPVFYYHTNACQMFGFVQDSYGDVLGTEHNEFLSEFHALPHGAQCLYIRFAGRKGRVFHSGNLRYPEIKDIPAALRALEQARFISAVREGDYQDFLGALTKPQIIDLLSSAVPKETFKRSWKKEVLLQVAQDRVAFGQAIIAPQFLVQRRESSLQYLGFLYFGKIEESFQKFTLRDLGLMRAPDFKDNYEARFDDPAQAQAAYFYAEAVHRLKTGSDRDVASLIDEFEIWPQPLCEHSEAGRDKLLKKLGGLCERLGDTDTALRLYAGSDAPHSNEREIRLRYSRGDKAWVQTRLEEIIDNPGSDDAHNFALDFYARKFKKKRTSEVTDILRAGDILHIDEAFKNAPEKAAKAHYQAKGIGAFRTENALWRSLFGLLFWDLLYCPETAKVHNSFERLPAGLKIGSFYCDNEELIEECLGQLKNTSAAHVQILKTVSRHHGTPNGIFRWNGRILDHLRPFLEAAPTDGLATILRMMAQKYQDMRDGFPDLMLIEQGPDQGRASFVEVKSEGDVIRRNQLTRIKQLRAAGFPADIARIKWTVDPNQIYVVVDVETTGGRAPLHRVTEIGAVKLQGGQVIDRFQTLLNPERSIPSHITRLTGISQKMVAEAPAFAEIAAAFSTFLDGAIFAAHNVNFDYGFINAEFKRAGYHFSMPKICTCAGMRKHYPGYKSYSLKNLCETFGISLETHHRAMCDAEAAAELLCLVNEKRLAGP